MTTRPNSLTQITAELRTARALCDDASARIAAAETALEGSLAEGADTPFSPPSTTPKHRRLHRPGPIPKLDADPELRAFVLARIDHMTFVDLAAAVAETFPPDRCVGKSTIHTWWQKRKHSDAHSS